MGSGTFPIVHTEELPSGRPSAPLADPSRLARGRQEIPAAIFQVGRKALELDQFIQEAKGALDLTNLQRQDSEFKNAAIDALDSPDLDIFDDEVITAIKQKADTDRTAQVSKYDAANFNYQVHLNKTSAAWDETFADRVNEIRTDNLRDNYELNAQSLLERGDIAGHNKLLTGMRNSGVISQAKFDYQKKNAHTNSIFAQASRNLEQGNLGMSELLLNSLNVKKLDADQLRYRNKLLKATTQTSKEQTDATISEVVVQKNNLKDASTLEKTASAQQMKQSLIDGGVTGDALERWFGILDKWSGGETDPTEEYDPQIYTAVNAQVMLNPDKITDQQIYSLVGLGTEGGISIDQAQALVTLRRNNAKPGASTSKEMNQRYQTILKGWHSANLFEGDAVEAATKYTVMANKWTTWAGENPDATAKEGEAFFAELTDGVTKQAWYNKFIKRFFTPTYERIPTKVRLGLGFQYYGIRPGHPIWDEIEKQKQEQEQANPIREVGVPFEIEGKGWYMLDSKPDEDGNRRYEKLEVK